MPCTSCSGVCVDTNTDTANCGSCGTVCGAGNICVAGSCQLSCPEGTMTCSGACANVSIDPMHCGSCTTVCMADESCVSGACAKVCTAPQKVCNSLCVDPTTDRANCGDCNKPCGPGQVCSMGACSESCGGGLSTCGTGTTATCANLQDDNTNCGMCSKSCTANQRCFEGACVVSFPTPTLCTDLDGGARPLFTRLYLNGQPSRPFEALCGADGGTYLPLANTDPASNFSHYPAGPILSGTDVVTHFTAVRLDLTVVGVDGGVGLQADGGGISDAGLQYYLYPSDLAYSTSTGLLTRPGSPDISQLSWASASDCSNPGSAQGTANVNLQGTGFSVRGQFVLSGFEPGMGATNFSAYRQVVDLTGGGYCGGNSPLGGKLLINWCPAPGLEVCDALDNDCDGIVDNLSDGGICQ